MVSLRGVAHQNTNAYQENIYEEILPHLTYHGGVELIKNKGMNGD